MPPAYGSPTRGSTASRLTRSPPFTSPRAAAGGRVPEEVGQVLRRWAARTGFLRLSEREKVWNAWQDLLGPDASHTRLEGLRKNVATFHVDSSALLSELNNFRRQELLEELRGRVKSYFIRDLRFRLEKRRTPREEPENRVPPSSPRPTLAEPPPRRRCFRD